VISVNVSDFTPKQKQLLLSYLRRFIPCGPLSRISCLHFHGTQEEFTEALRRAGIFDPLK